MTAPHPLRGRTALVTGASRRAGIGFATARRLAALGASVYLHHHTPHDAEQPWGADPDGPEALAAAVRDQAAPGAVVAHGPGDLADPAVPAALVGEAAGALGGRLDILIANQALSGHDGPLDDLTADMLDRHYRVNTRASVLLVQAFARRHGQAGPDAPPGRIVLMTSGQDQRGGMPGQIPYALSKGALASITRSLATDLAARRITVNAVNPGPVDTGYLTGEHHAVIAGLFPGGRWGTPEDAARLITWLASDDAGWVTGEVINSEGGFAR
ncbi:SDR family oxidoreductase [Streptomyces harbinensis]|uniref:SDR family oxidoreductase n=1 Tax=Streptomyces harbinensis TaxID=1176198 RepID=UPI0033987469